MHVRNTFTTEKSGVWVELFEAVLLGILCDMVRRAVQSADVLRPTPAVRVPIQQGQHCQELLRGTACLIWNDVLVIVCSKSVAPNFSTAIFS